MLRPYQSEAESDIYNEWRLGAQNTALVLSPGGGKTVIASSIISKHKGASCIIAHRQELVIQISLSYAKMGIRHRIIGPKKVIKLAVQSHMAAFGYTAYDPNALCAVAGVLSLLTRKNIKDWCRSVTLWILDEAHHLLRGNTWGKAVALFPNARGLCMTGTLIRTDGKGLGSHADGCIDSFVLSRDTHGLIEMGYLTPYVLNVPPKSIDTTNVHIDSGGDFNKKELKVAARSSTIVGDVVGEYIKNSYGKRGITFATDLETAQDIADQYNVRGVPAQMVCGDTSDRDRVDALRKLKNGEILQLVNVDLFGEGFDLPAIEVVSKARPTASVGLYLQQSGRVLRILVNMSMDKYAKLTDSQRRQIIADGPKPIGRIIDHVGNIRHGFPDDHRTWTLDRRDKRSCDQGGEIPIKGCPECARAYPRTLRTCPYCGFTPVPASRSGPEFVDGDLLELDAETIARMRGEVANVDKPAEVYRAELQRKFTPYVGQLAHVKRHVKRQEMQAALRFSMSWWAGYQRHMGRSDSESYRRFYFTFGIDALTAQTLKTSEAIELINKINKYLEGRV